MSRSISISKSRSRTPEKRQSSLDLERENACPFLIRLYITKGKHTPLSEFDEGKFPLRDEFHLYGWKHSTPTSLIQLLLPTFPPTYRSPLARFSFRHIYVDASQRGLYRSKDLISFTGRDLMSTYPSLDGTETLGSRNNIDEKTLDDYGFITGDLLSVSLYVPEPKIPAGGPRVGPGAGNGNGISIKGQTSFGWNEARAGPRDVVPERGSEGGAWSRGEPLPAQSFRGGRGGHGREDGAWRGRGMGVRGVGKRSRSPDRNGDRRSRSPIPAPRDRGASFSRR